MNDPDSGDRVPDRFLLGEHLVEPDLNRVTGPAGVQSIEPRLMEVLVYLAAHPGQVVGRDELLDGVWGDVVVGEEALTRAVSELRRVFDDDPREPRVIETIRKGGYRLVAPVESVEPGEEVGSGRPWRYWTMPIVVALLALLAFKLFSVVGTRFFGPESTDGPSAPPRPVPVTTYTGSEDTPAISPDGTMLAFAWNGPDEDNMDIYVKPLGEESPRRLTDDPGFDMWPAWSPDQRRLAYLHADDEGMGVYVLDLAGGEPVKVADGGVMVWGVDWSPHGDLLVFASITAQGEPCRLFLVPAAGGAVRSFGEPPAGWRGDRLPCWSPDGETIAFARIDSHNRHEIWLRDATGGEPRQLTRDVIRCRGLDWFPDGGSVVLSGFVNGTYNLWRADLGTGKLSWVPATGEWLFMPSVARDGQTVYQAQSFEKNVWRITRSDDPADGLATAPVITSTRWDCEAYHSPDGEELAFTSARSGHLEIWTCRRDGSHPRQLTRFQGPGVGNPRWRPDGLSIAFYGSPQGLAQIHLIDPEGGEPARLTDDPWNHLLSGWSRDGVWIYYGQDREGEWELWRLRADESEVRERVATSGAVFGREAPEGDLLYITRMDTPGLWSLPLVEGKPDTNAEPTAVLTELPRPGDWANWAVGEDGILCVRYADGATEIVLCDPAGNEPVVVAEVPNVASPSLELSPDGREILYARVESTVNDIWLLPAGW